MSDHMPTALDAAVARCLSEPVISEASADRLRPTLDAFARYAEAAGVECLRNVTAEVAAAFVGSRLRTGRRSTTATQYNRRTALRMLFASARRLGLVDGDPTLDLLLPAVTSLPTRPLTNDEIERCRHVAQWSSTQTAAAWALAEATARGVEIARVTDRDVDLVRRTVKLPGGARTEPRQASLTSWGVESLGRRLKAGRSATGVAFSGSSRSSGQASTCRAISTVLVRAGVAGQPDVRPGSVAGWAGRRVFDDTGSVEAAARAMGVRSLDRAARLIGLDWSTDA